MAQQQHGVDASHLLVEDLVRLLDEDAVAHPAAHHGASACCDPHGSSACCGPSAGLGLHAGAGATAPQARPGSPITDPFLLPGDEQTWEADDWIWDACHLAALPKASQLQQQQQVQQQHATICCQALKRRRLPGEQDAPAVAAAAQAALVPPHLPGHPHTTSSAPALPLPGPPPAPGVGNSCCNFQLPAMHAPQQAWPAAATGPGAHSSSLAYPTAASAWPPAPAAAAGAGGNVYGGMPGALLHAPGNTTAALAGVAARPAPRPPAPRITPDSAGGGDDSDTDADPDVGRRSGAGATGGSRKLGTAPSGSLQPATYTGRLEDLVQLADNFNDDGVGRMTCQVAGCGKDLSSLKDYHQRYRICEVHIKLPQVLRGGRLQRFCQQCGRFHDLAAFDAGRKSCREQLSKHNARRRRRAQIEAQKAKAVEQLAGDGPIATALVAAGSGGNDPPNGGGAAGSSVPDGLLAAEAGTASGGLGDVGRLLTALIQNPTQLHALRLLLGVQTHPALPVMQPFSPSDPPPAGTASAASQPAGAAGSGDAGAAGTGGAEGNSPPAAPDPPGLSLARDMVDGRGVWAPSFDSEHQALRISMKLFNRTPADLPQDLRQQVAGWLSTMPAALCGAIRPGCVFLTLHALVNKPTHDDALRRGLASLLGHLRHPGGCALWRTGVYVVQLGGEMAMVVEGRVTSYYRHSQLSPCGPEPAQPVPIEAPPPASLFAPDAAGAEERRYPALAAVEPLCVAAAESAATVRLTLRGANLGEPGVEVIVRQRNTQLRLAAVRVRDKKADAAGHRAGELYAVDVPVAHSPGSTTGLLHGLAWIEVARGAWLSPARPCLLVPDAVLAAEVAALLAPASRAQGALSAAACDALLVDLSLVLAHANGDTCTHEGPKGAHVSGGRNALVPAFHVTHHAALSLKARRLLLFACDMGWSAVAARVLPLASAACGCAVEVVDAVHASSPPPVCPPGCEYEPLLEAASRSRRGGRGLSLLHRVVRGGSLALLQGVLHWGAVTGYAWRADRNGPAGITPLHLAALQEDPRLLLALLDYAPPGAFTGLQAADGTTPFHLAFQMGHFTLDSLAGLLAAEDLLPAACSKAAEQQAADGGAVTAGGVAASKRRRTTTLAAGDSAAAKLERVLGGAGGEVDPCVRCHSTLPPMMLSIAAVCAECGVRVPCLGSLVKAAAAARTAAGHDTSHCAGCTVSTGPPRVTLQVSVGAKRPAQPAGPLDALDPRWSADCANNCAGAERDGDEHSEDGQAEVPACVHGHGSVFSVTAMCQGCHANRLLEVM